MKLSMIHIIDDHYLPAEFYDNQIKNTVPDLEYTDTRRVAAYNHFLCENTAHYPYIERKNNR